jgi:hypothetical protein
MDLFTLVPKLSLEMDPELAQIHRPLEDDLLFQRVNTDWLKPYPNTATLGSHSTPVEAILRELAVKRLYRWSYAETGYFVSAAWCYATSAASPWRQSPTTLP